MHLKAIQTVLNALCCLMGVPLIDIDKSGHRYHFIMVAVISAKSKMKIRAIKNGTSSTGSFQKPKD